MRKPKTMQDVNLLHLLLGTSRKTALIQLKEVFMRQLNEAVKNEKEFCSKAHREPVMQGKVLRDVENLLDQCRDVFEVEALASYVFDLNVVPTYLEIRHKSINLATMFPANRLVA